MADNSSPKDLEEWLLDKPIEWTRILAYRVSLRTLPLLNQLVEQSEKSLEVKNLLTLSSMRASLISNVGSSKLDASLVKAAVHSARTAYSPEYTNYAAARSNDAIRSAVHSICITDVPTVIISILNSVNDATQGMGPVVSFSLNETLNREKLCLTHATKKITPKKLLEKKLWYNSENPFISDWQSLKEALLALDLNWKFWIDWYQSKLDGTLHPGLTQVQQESLYYKIATFPNEFWEEGAEAINQRIAELLEGYDGGGKDFFLDDGFLGHDFLTGENQNDRISQNKESSSVKTEQFRTLINSPEFRSNVEQNKVAISFACAGVILQVEEYKKTVSGSNSLEPELKEHILGTLDNLTEAVNNIGNSLETGSDVISDEGLEEVASYFSRFCEVISCELENYIAPENIGKAVVPTGIILSCGGLGALLGGGIGFGVGGFIGKLITNNLKPKEIVDKIEENIDNPN
ncbi:MAG: hypothetical protein ACRBBJ_02720 [Rhodomicrobiaceae bacterium]